MFSHVMVGPNDIERAKRFCDAVLAVLGAGEPLRNTAGTTVEEPPRPREGLMGVLHLAYVRDPDGNKHCALHRPMVER